MKKSKKQETTVSKQMLKAVTTEQNLSEFTRQAMKDYGTEVVEQRAIPDYRDGLKPVQRMVLYSMYNQGINSKGGYKKAAKVVGDVLARFHPHGDQSCFQAMVNITGVRDKDDKTWVTRNSTVPLIEGYGNWGDYVDPAGAYRYVEARLSKFSDLILFDPDYLAVVETVPTFDNGEQVPLVLPAKLPVMLLNGSSSIAVGVAASSPAFKLEGVVKIVKMALQGKKITTELCAKTLEFEYPYGGVAISKIPERKEVMEGKGSILFRPSFKPDEKAKTLTFTSVCPGLMSVNTITTWMQKLDDVSGVKNVSDQCGKEGIRYVVTFQRNVDFQAMVGKCVELSTRSERFDIGITTRKADSATFSRASVPQIIELWTKWRLNLELKVLKRLIELEKAKLERQQLLLLAVDNLDVIVAALRTTTKDAKIKVNGELKTVDASTAYLMKHLKISYEKAHAILELKVRQLRRLERSTILETIKKIKAEIVSLTAHTKKPEGRILQDLNKLDVSKF